MNNRKLHFKVVLRTLHGKLPILTYGVYFPFFFHQKKLYVLRINVEHIIRFSPESGLTKTVTIRVTQMTVNYPNDRARF